MGLYFAVSENPEKDGVIWVLNPYRLNQSEVGKHKVLLQNFPEVNSILNISFKGEGASDKILGLMPSENDMRMFLQAGRATLHGTLELLPTRSVKKDYLYYWKIPASAKALLKHQLDVVGVRRSTLFPDLESLALDLGASSWGPPEPEGSNEEAT